MTSGKAVLTLALSCYWAALPSAQPRIFEISTNTARLGDDIIIYGDDFNPPEAQVLIGGAEAEVIDGNVAYLQVHVPGGALPGPIVISQSGKVAASSAYFNPLPVTPGILTNLLAVRPISSKTGFAPIAVVADLDGDSRQDIVAATEHSLEIFRNKGGPGALRSE